ncbi:hypothetical protein [Streptacidiphilus jiangxiensis]|uniref:Uncharacterized protein n=1 Tax=Streptacidiphilus jiangxiensis TaxID=235985 RepID=A0A1H7Y4E4_STRJI|nr:hypothetical protein [Streptacidiphilus jiangxiensis]SEM40059.1 hypothetical protein SAMN05414137_12665 [Streptacidiphilus jiangxiensis]
MSTSAALPPPETGPDMTGLLLRALGEGFGLSLLLGLALFAVGVPLPLAGGLTVFAAAVAYGVATGRQERPSERWVVGLARTTTFWCIGLPLMLAVAAVAYPGVLLVGALFWLLPQAGLGVGGTALIRRRHYVGGVLLKLISLLPYSLGLLVVTATQAMTSGDWTGFALGLSAAGLALGLVASAVTAHTTAPLGGGR